MKKIVTLTFILINISLPAIAIAENELDKGLVAKSIESEFFYQPKVGQSALELNYSSANMSGTISVTSFTMPSSSLSFSYFYGLNDENALGVYNSNGITSLTAGTTTQKATGMSDWTLAYRANRHKLFFGFDAVVIATTAKNSSSTSDGNRYQGGTSFSPYLGSKFNENFGFKLSYLGYQGRAIDNSPYQNSEKTGGESTSFALFVEKPYSNGLLGYYFNLTSSTDATIKKYGSGGSISTSTDYGMKITGVGFKGNYSTDPMTSLLWDISYGSITSNSSLITFNATLALSFGARFIF